MSFLDKIFGSEQSLQKCPRCLGKGHVDWDDIMRLDKELKWMPGSCAYCNGIGKVGSKIVEKVAVDTTYLVTNLSADEANKVRNGDPEALKRGKQYDEQIDAFIDQISFLVTKTDLEIDQIAEFFLIGKENSEFYESEKENLIDYINRLKQKKER
ncbi:MAG: hypothetical protein ACK5DD_13470 [Cyclobacteriaceae bacterium]|jgi:ribosomal protein S13